jgi:hypothetical protein
VRGARRDVRAAVRTDRHVRRGSLLGRLVHQPNRVVRRAVLRPVYGPIRHRSPRHQVLLQVKEMHAKARVLAFVPWRPSILRGRPSRDASSPRSR